VIVAPLPDINGHDMMPVPDSPQLILLVREQLPHQPSQWAALSATAPTSGWRGQIVFDRSYPNGHFQR
jgi:hypothetical protein